MATINQIKQSSAVQVVEAIAKQGRQLEVIAEQGRQLEAIGKRFCENIQTHEGRIRHLTRQIYGREIDPRDYGAMADCLMAEFQLTVPDVRELSYDHVSSLLGFVYRIPRAATKEDRRVFIAKAVAFCRAVEAIPPEQCPSGRVALKALMSVPAIRQAIERGQAGAAFEVTPKQRGRPEVDPQRNAEIRAMHFEEGKNELQIAYKLDISKNAVKGVIRRTKGH